MSRFVRRTVACLALPAVVHAAARVVGAQTAPAAPGAAPVVSSSPTSAPASAPSEQKAPRRPFGRWIAAVGTDALGRDAGDVAPGVAAQLGYELRAGGPGSRLAFRLAGDYWRTGRRYTGVVFDESLAIRRTTTLVGASLSAVVRLPDAGRLRPYAVAGVGAQQYSQRNESDWMALGGNASSQVVYLPPVRVNAAAFTAGLGASARVGRARPFAEARLTTLPALTAVGAGQVRALVTFGIRF